MSNSQGTCAVNPKLGGESPLRTTDSGQTTLSVPWLFFMWAVFILTSHFIPSFEKNWGPVPPV